MPRISEMYFKAGVLFLVVSVAVGLQMSITGVHSVGGAHAHASLIGWVSSAIFGAYFALNPGKAETKLAYAQFWIFVGAATAMSLALYFMLMGYKGLSYVVAGSSILVLLGVVLFAFVVFSRSETVLLTEHRRA
jgi:hypothetical protein